MAQNSRQFELVLLGATGYTGKLVAEWMSTHMPEDLEWAVAGRNTKKLQGVVDELSKLVPGRAPPAIETCGLEKEALKSLAQKTRLMITTIGPYMFYGEPVLAACAETGTHYLDCTGETPWYYDMVSKYHDTAKKTGAIIIPECGLDSVPADIMTFVLARHVRKTLQAPTSSVTLTLHDLKSGVSGGTTSTGLNILTHYPLKKLATAFEPYSLSPVRPTDSSPPPTSSLIYRLLGLLNIPELGGVQTQGVMASIDVCMVHRSWGLFETAAKEPSSTDSSYGPKFRFTEYMRANSIITGFLFKLGMTLAALSIAFPPTRWILSPLINRFLIPAPGEGPSKEAMKNDFMSYRGLAIADTPKHERFLGKIDFAHGGYAVTGLTLAAAADVILRGDLGATQAGKLGGGILTPATLGEQFVDKLKAFGISIEVAAL